MKRQHNRADKTALEVNSIQPCGGNNRLFSNDHKTLSYQQQIAREDGY